MTNKTFSNKALLLSAAVSSFLVVQAFGDQSNSSVWAQTTTSGRTLEELQGAATGEVSNSLEDLQGAAAALEADRNSRTPNYTGTSVDLPATEAAATGGDVNVIAKLSSETGRATVRLTNNTGAEVIYEAIGQTPPRTLVSGDSAQLDNLPMPTTITAERKNFGLVDMVVTVGEDGILNVTLEQSEFDEVQGALRIREDGYVFVN